MTTWNPFILHSRLHNPTLVMYTYGRIWEFKGWDVGTWMGRIVYVITCKIYNIFPSLPPQSHDCKTLIDAVYLPCYYLFSCLIMNRWQNPLKFRLRSGYCVSHHFILKDFYGNPYKGMHMVTNDDGRLDHGLAKTILRTGDEILDELYI